MNRVLTIVLFLLADIAGSTNITWGQTDYVRNLQTAAVRNNVSSNHWGHWGPVPEIYLGWGNHTNRLIPVYTFGTKGAGRGMDLTDYSGENSVYRSGAELERIYGRVPSNTVNPQAEYLDQTDLFRLQQAALEAGKKHIFLVVFDGMDWQTTWAAAIYNRQAVTYRSGRGTGTHFQEYTAGDTTQFGFMVTSPYCVELESNVTLQTVGKPKKDQWGGYHPGKMGPDPWTPGTDWFYPIGKAGHDPRMPGEHAVPDSAATATAMTTGVKVPNDAVNVDAQNRQLKTIAHLAQEQGRAVGVVTSVPISHATPACAYAHNVHRDDYQDLTRDLLGLPSVAHPQRPLAGVDVLIGCGFGDVISPENAEQEGRRQGSGFEPGNRWITQPDLQSIDASRGGRYVVAQRQPGTSGREQLARHARLAAQTGKRLFGFYGTVKGHLPFQTSDGQFNPTVGRQHAAEEYTPADIAENPTLADMTRAALAVLELRSQGFWLMVEAGDVDWANHDDNIDNSIGAVNSGDAAVKAITDWVERHSNWQESLLIVTADHGHYLVLEQPQKLVGQ